MASLNVTSGINFCDFAEKRCSMHDFIVYASTNIASIIINVLHLFVLRKIPGLKERNYFWVLFNLTFSDIAMSVAVIIFVNCDAWNLRNCFITISAFATITCTFQVRYWLLTLAVLDRYYAVCKPFKYTTSKFINNVGKWAAVVWIASAVLAFAEGFTICSHLCLDSVPDSVHAMLSQVSNYFDFAVVLAVMVPFTTSTVLLVKVSLELKRMKQRRNATVEDKETRSATRYITSVFIMFYVSIIPSIVYAGVEKVTKDDPEADFTWLVSLSLFAHFLYGIGNVIMYGVLNKAYVAQIRSIFEPLCAAGKVSPQ